MNQYDQEYFFIRCADDERLPFLSPDENTEDRNFSYEKQPFGSPPLVFTNGFQDYDQKKKIRPLKDLPDILFHGTNLVVRTPIRERLLAIDVQDLHMHPAIYIHDDKRWHEDYWYMTFTSFFDCWDRDNSSFEDEPLEMGGLKLHSVYTYSLNHQLLDRTPLDRRILFKMGGTQDGFVVCHKSILMTVFGGPGRNGASYVRVDEY